ncbi:MAG: hypothetical protein WD771_10480 [Gemmatimonadaceae bacterium]
MPIRRPRGPKPALRHLPFLEATAQAKEDSGDRRALQAAFLTLRLLDHWMALGAEIADPSGQAFRATRVAIDAVDDDSESRSALAGIVDAIAMLQDPDAQPLLPRVFAYGGLIENRGALPLAADVYETVTRYVDSRTHFDLAFDAHMRQGYCFRTIGEFDRAERGYETAGALAARTRDRGRVLYSRIGGAKVAWSRGNLPEADTNLRAIAAEAETLGDARLHAIALHDCGAIARLRGDLPRAVRQVFEAFKRTTDESEKERVLMDLGAYLGESGAFRTARAALSILETGARTQEMRWHAQVNLLDLAVLERSEPLFEMYLRQLESSALPTRLQLSFLRDGARGLARFGRTRDARAFVNRGAELAEATGTQQLRFQFETLAAELDQVAEEYKRNRPTPTPAPDDIATTIEELLRGTAVPA